MMQLRRDGEVDSFLHDKPRPHRTTFRRGRAAAAPSDAEPKAWYVQYLPSGGLLLFFFLVMRYGSSGDGPAAPGALSARTHLHTPMGDGAGASGAAQWNGYDDDTYDDDMIPDGDADDDEGWVDYDELDDEFLDDDMDDAEDDLDDDMDDGEDEDDADDDDEFLDDDMDDGDDDVDDVVNEDADVDAVGEDDGDDEASTVAPTEPPKVEPPKVEPPKAEPPKKAEPPQATSTGATATTYSADAPKPPPLANPHNFRFVHRPIPAQLVSLSDVGRNSVVLTGVTTGVQVKVPPQSDPLTKQHGKWGFFDGYGSDGMTSGARPTVDYAKYEAGDVPAADFPDDAWQADAVYVNHFLDAAENLITRARESIYEEYGFPKDGPSPLRDTALGFHVADDTDPKASVWDEKTPVGVYKKDFDGLVRRLLHAMMTNEEFKVAVNGHSVSAGHDNNFWQSYIHQFHHLMEPIFARLGMKLSSYNYGRGGMGTLQDLFAGTCTLGDPDVLMWDSGMTEREKHIKDAFYRQAILAGTRVPFFIGEAAFRKSGGEVAAVKQDASGMPTTPMDEPGRSAVPWAARYLVCEKDEMNCGKPAMRFDRLCWDETITDYLPTTKQKDPSGGGGWHPGWRTHRLTSRKMGLLFLHALEHAVALWQEKTSGGGYPLDGQYWHVTEHYAEQRRASLATVADSACMNFHESLRKVCSVPMRGRSEFTGRANPDRTSLRSIIRPTKDGYVPKMEQEVVYDRAVSFDRQQIPKGEVDIRAIVGARRLGPAADTDVVAIDTADTERGPAADADPLHTPHLRALANKIVPGHGWELLPASDNGVPVGYCDGSTDYHSCKRDANTDCLANDHQDARGGVFGDDLSGWIVFDIDKVTEGFVVLKLETWHKTPLDVRTEGWTEIDEGRKRRLTAEEMEELTGEEREEALYPRRGLLVSHWPDDIVIDYAVDGVVTTLDKDMLTEKVMHTQRVVELLVLHDKKPAKPKDMEIAVRVRCATSVRKCHINITHLYWA